MVRFRVHWLCFGLTFASVAQAATLLDATALAGIVQSRDGPACPSNVGIINGGFEASSVQPWNGVLDTITLSSPGFQSQHAAVLNGSEVGIIQRLIPVCQETQYQISFEYKVLAACTTCTLGVSVFAGGNVSSANIALMAGTWMNASLIYNSTTLNYTNLQFLTRDSNGSGNGLSIVLIDNVAIAEVYRLDPSDCPRSLTLRNGGFDSRTIAPWYTYHQPATVLPNYNFVSPGYQNSPAALAIHFPKMSTPKPNDTYSFYIRQVYTGACALYNYTTTFAVNWGHYNYTSSDPFSGCQLKANPGCTGKGRVTPLYTHAGNPPGWLHHSFTCIIKDNADPTFELYVFCKTEQPHNPILPFTMLIDAINVSVTPM